MEIKEKLLSLIPKKPIVQEVSIPDLKQYLVNGYEEIRQVKQENLKLETELENQKKFEQLYGGALVTLEEFRRRDEENNKEIGKLKEKIKQKQDELDTLNSELNTYKIKQYEYDKKEAKMKQIIEEEKATVLCKIKENLSYKIENTKGRLSKVDIINIINNFKF